MHIKLPLLVIAFSSKRIFSLENEAGDIYIPIFSDTSLARDYSDTIRGDKTQLQTRILVEPEKALNFFEVLALKNPQMYVAFDPPIKKTNRISAFPIMEFTCMLKNSLIADRQMEGTPLPPHTS